MIKIVEILEERQSQEVRTLNPNRYDMYKFKHIVSKLNGDTNEKESY